MININRDELTKYKRIGSGEFATVYTDYKYAYKIYHRLCIRYTEDICCKNPALFYRPIKINRLMNIDKKINNTDLVKDIINVDGKFGGVLLPYYEGDTLSHFINLPFETKINICKQILENSKELVDYYIYPIDIALRNIIYSNGEAKMIDLDDVVTKVSLLPNRHYYGKTMMGVDSTIKTFLDEVDHINSRFMIGKEIEKFLVRQRETVEQKTTYNNIINYINRKSHYNNYLLLSDDSDIDVIQDFKNKGYRIILVRDKNSFLQDKDYLLKKINEYYKNEIELYDVVENRCIDRYLNNEAVDNVLELHNKSLVKKIYR